MFIQAHARTNMVHLRAPYAQPAVTLFKQALSCVSYVLR